jgi:putative addiction module killer protein
VQVKKSTEYDAWLKTLKDITSKARILQRVDRLVAGNPGDHRNLTDGVTELKMDFGPGFRVYYTQRLSELILLWYGGDKSSQELDIAKAIQIAKDYKQKEDDDKAIEAKLNKAKALKSASQGKSQRKTKGKK